MRLGPAAICAIVGALVSASWLAAQDAGLVIPGRGIAVQEWMVAVDASSVRHITTFSMTKD